MDLLGIQRCSPEVTTEEEKLGVVDDVETVLFSFVVGHGVGVGGVLEVGVVAAA